MQQLYQALIAIIVANFSSDYPNITTTKFTGYPIFQGYQNNYALPANGKYVIITAKPQKNQILNSNSITDPTNDIQQYVTLFSSEFQVDFYGQNAEENARGFQVLMSSNYADNFFLDNSYACSVNRVKDVINLTDVLGRDMYLPRYAVICSLFNNPTITTPLATYAGFVDNIRFADIQTS